MGYLHINNLYKDQRILTVKRIFALEKVHGTSANLRWSATEGLRYSSGGAPAALYKSIFDHESLVRCFTALGHDSVEVYGEAYGGKEQGMSATYGKSLQFIAFDVKIGGVWLAVENAADVAAKVGVDFVPYEEGPAELPWIDEQRDRDSIVAINRGMGPGKRREGVVLRPTFELYTSNGDRLIAKHRRDEFRETASPRPVEGELTVLSDAEEIALEWVTDMRLQHCLQKMPVTENAMSIIPDLIRAMIEDVEREGAGEIVTSKEARRAIGTRTKDLYKKLITRSIT